MTTIQDPVVEECQRCALLPIRPKLHMEFIVPIYRGRELVGPLFEFMNLLAERFPIRIGLCIVLDGDIDGCEDEILSQRQYKNFDFRYAVLSKNFGVGPALQAGLAGSSACVVAAFGADLQEPSDLFWEFWVTMMDPKVDLVLGQRESRDDPWLDRSLAATYWALYRRFVSPGAPVGGFDVFAASNQVAQSIAGLSEKNTNITAQIDWLGFNRLTIPFHRQSRSQGKSSWTFKRKLRLFMDSFYGFTDLPIRMLQVGGLLGIFSFVSISALVAILWLVSGFGNLGVIAILISIGFSTSLILFALGVVAGYIARTFDNSKERPTYIIRREWP